MGEDRPEDGEMPLPGGEVGPGGMLPARGPGRDGRSPALDRPEEALADLSILASGLATLVVEGGQASVRFQERAFKVDLLPREVLRQSADLRPRLELLAGEAR